MRGKSAVLCDLQVQSFNNEDRRRDSRREKGARGTLSLHDTLRYPDRGHNRIVLDHGIGTRDRKEGALTNSGFSLVRSPCQSNDEHHAHCADDNICDIAQRSVVPHALDSACRVYAHSGVDGWQGRIGEDVGRMVEYLFSCVSYRYDWWRWTGPGDKRDCTKCRMAQSCTRRQTVQSQS